MNDERINIRALNGIQTDGLSVQAIKACASLGPAAVAVRGMS
jgi:hypothetical protein